MEKPRPCGCKGIRTCLICEEQYNISKPNLFAELQAKKCYSYCPDCNKAFPGWDVSWENEHPNHNGTPIEFPGIYIQTNFLSQNETIQLIKDIDQLPWDLSQSGRRKQNYGPKCNFKKRKLRIGAFDGFPVTTKFVQEKFNDVPLLKGFQTIEQCSLEYTPEKGASIDPHIDDCWIWGNRIVTANVLGNAVLTMIPYRGPESRYNLNFHKQFSSTDYEEPPENIVVRVPMPAGSLMVIHGPARYNWEHCVLREDITQRRVCLAYREFTKPYLPNGTFNEDSNEIFKVAKHFW